MAQAINPPPHEVVETVPIEVAIAAVPARLEEAQSELAALRRAVDYLCELVEPLTEPAQLTTVVLSRAVPVLMADERSVKTASLGVINPGDFTILLGIGGGRASIAAQAIQVPPQSLVVLPLAAGDVEVGTEDSLAGGDAVVHLLRYSTVQPAFLGAVTPAAP